MNRVPSWLPRRPGPRVRHTRTEIKEQELLTDRLYDDRLHRLISEDFFRQRWDQLEEKRSQLSRDLARHQQAEGAYMELGSKLIELIAQAPQIFERADAEQRRELVGLLTSKRVLKGRTLEFELRKPFDALVSAANSENGWGGRIRTYVWRIQSPLPYHLATPQWFRFAPQYRVALLLKERAGARRPVHERSGQG